tara:strand:+ start:1189 stop:1749 length:561 start_codon:yes stop_codon:yes gene_type:complete
MLEKELNIFGKEVIRRAKKNLTKNKIKDSNLSKSLKFSVKNNVLTFSMNDYGEFIDAGVKGVGGTKADYKLDGKTIKGEKWKLKKVTNRKFKYTNKKPPFMAFNGWSIKKGIAPRNKKGQFTSRKSILFAIANSVYHTGLKTTDFFQDAFYDEVDNMTDRLSNSLALKIELALVDSIENNKKIKII